MAFQARITVFFSWGDYGWTETLFTDASGYSVAQTQANAYCNDRVRLLTPPAKIIANRVSDDTKYRDALVRFYGDSLIGTAGGGTLTPNDCLLLRLVGDPFVRRSLYLRGIPGDIVDGNVRYFPNPAWTGLVNVLKDRLTSGKYRVRGYVGGTPPPRIGLSSIAAPNTFTTVEDHPYNPGDLIYIGGVRGKRNPLGRWIVATIPSVRTFTLSGVDLPQDYTYTPLTCYVKKLNVSYTTITDVQDERITRRATGRPLGVPHGRRSPIRR